MVADDHQVTHVKVEIDTACRIGYEKDMTWKFIFLTPFLCAPDSKYIMEEIMEI